MPPKNCKSFVRKSFENQGRLYWPADGGSAKLADLVRQADKPTRCVFIKPSPRHGLTHPFQDITHPKSKC